MENTQDTQKLEHFFRDPNTGDGLLQPGISGPACANIRHALRILGYNIEYGDRFDDDLAKVILKFQKDNDHTSLDGMFGPGTRKLLVSKLLQLGNTGIFQRMRTPEASYIEATVIHYHELIKVYQKRKNVLELQIAAFGLYVPPHIQIDMEEAQAEIQKYQRMIIELEHQKMV